MQLYIYVEIQQKRIVLYRSIIELTTIE